MISEATLALNGQISYVQVKRASMLLRVLNNNVRQKILKLLEERGQLTVTEIYVHMRMQQSVTSQHLALLRRAQIVSATRQGKLIFYELNPTRLKEINHFIEVLLK